MGKNKTQGNKDLRAQRTAENKQASEGGKTWVWGVAFFALMFGAGMVQFVLTLMDVAGAGYGARGLYALDVTDEAAMKHAFFSGQPHVIYCVSDKTENQPVPDMIVKVKEKLAAQKGTEDVVMLKANCFKKLSSGKTIMERFKFGKNESFIGIFANQEKPNMLNHFGKAKDVAKQIKQFVTPRLTSVILLKHFRKVQTRRTVIVMAGKSKSLIAGLEEKFKPYVYPYRGVGFFSVDTGFWKMNLDQDLVDTRPAGTESVGDAVAFIKGSNEKGAFWKQAFFQGNINNPSELEEWIKLVQAGGQEDWYTTESLPSIKARPSPTTTTTPKPGEPEEASKFGGKEHVGTLQEEEESSDGDEEIVPLAEGEEEEEEVEL